MHIIAKKWMLLPKAEDFFFLSAKSCFSSPKLNWYLGQNLQFIDNIRNLFTKKADNFLLWSLSVHSHNYFQVLQKKVYVVVFKLKFWNKFNQFKTWLYIVNQCNLDDYLSSTVEKRWFLLVVQVVLENSTILQAGQSSNKMHFTLDLHD